VALRYIFHYPETNGTEADMLDPGPLQDVAARAEAAGFDAFALTEHPIPGARWLSSGGHQSLDPFVALGFVAAATSRIRLLTHLSVATYRNPFLLAKAAATVDRLSGGRMVLGIGAGYLKGEFFALGVDFEERNALFEEVLEVLPLHWSGEPFSYKGLHFDARDVIARPKPVQDPIPIWIGGNSKAARRRAAERAQGWMPMMAPPQVAATARTPAIETPDQLAGLISEVRQAAAASGRTDELDVLYSYSDPGLAAPAQDADRHRQALAEIEKLGANWVVISVHTRDPSATYDFLDAFGSTYLS
jgi:probable F420-dependent oxidoreductase